MRRLLIAILIVVSTQVDGQTIKLTDYLIFPRLDSTYWEADFEQLNSEYSPIANRYQTCVYSQTDTTRSRFCFNTTLGHVQLDTSLHNFSADNLIGEWTVVRFGTFEIADSILTDSKIIFRKEIVTNEQNQDLGLILFTNNRIMTKLKNIDDIPKRNKKYKILNGRYLTTKKITGYSGATIIGITKEGFLILDDHTFRSLANKDKYLLFKTTIRRIILKKNTTA